MKIGERLGDAGTVAFAQQIDARVSESLAGRFHIGDHFGNGVAGQVHPFGLQARGRGRQRPAQIGDRFGTESISIDAFDGTRDFPTVKLGRPLHAAVPDQHHVMAGQQPRGRPILHVARPGSAFKMEDRIRRARIWEMNTNDGESNEPGARIAINVMRSRCDPAAWGRTSRAERFKGSSAAYQAFMDNIAAPRSGEFGPHTRVPVGKQLIGHGRLTWHRQHRPNVQGLVSPMNLVEWLRQNENTVDWNVFSSPWDEMQLTHNPFRQEQVDAILLASRIFQFKAPRVLDLGCGPGILGRMIIQKRPSVQYVGVDGDPLMLEAMRHLPKGNDFQGVLVDLRRTEWTRDYTGQFDSIISLTALHWLSQPHQKEIYRAAFHMLKPGGTFAVGDPYRPQDIKELNALKAFQSERMSSQTGQTWEEFWRRFFERFPIKDIYTVYHWEKGYREPFEGSDDGYPLSFHLDALEEAGFSQRAVYWKKGLRAVYGGKK